MKVKDLINDTLGMDFEVFYKECEKKSSGDYSTSASSGEGSKSASSGNSSTSASSGEGSKSASSGYNSTSASSGNSSTSASSGDYSTSASSGEGSTSASSGYNSTSASSGEGSTSASSGDCSTSASSGEGSTSASSGDYSSAVANGFFASVSGSEGNVLACIEFDSDKNPIGFAGGIVGQNGIKENTFYCAHEGQLKELIEIDGLKSILLSKRGNVMKVLMRDFTIQYVVTDGTNLAHGETLKQAKEALKYKISKRDLSEFENLTTKSVLSYKEALVCYRSITGACESGINSWLKSQGIDEKDYKIFEMINLTKNAYGGDIFANFFKNK